MGCDVHMFVEVYNDENKKWEFIKDKFIDEWYFEKAVKQISDFFGLTPKESKLILIKYVQKKTSRNKLYKRIIEEYLPQVLNLESEEWVPYSSTSIPNFMTSSVFIGRNYTLFGVLNNVRSFNSETITDIDRGLPDDVSDEIYSDYEFMGPDAHSASHIYLNEILESRFYKMSNSKLHSYGLGTHFFRGSVKKLLKLKKDPDKIRIVFWFDN
jgi:hypothetical protein